MAKITERRASTPTDFLRGIEFQGFNSQQASTAIKSAQRARKKQGRRREADAQQSSLHIYAALFTCIQALLAQPFRQQIRYLNVIQVAE